MFGPILQNFERERAGLTERCAYWNGFGGHGVGGPGTAWLGELRRERGSGGASEHLAPIESRDLHVWVFLRSGVLTEATVTCLLL
jgi:hypothetical protein